MLEKGMKEKITKIVNLCQNGRKFCYITMISLKDVCIQLYFLDGWMNDLQFYVLLQSISVISGG